MMRTGWILALCVGLALAAVGDNTDIFLGEDWESGYIKLDESAELFYWFFRARNKDKNAPFVLWFQGGPGCSDMLNVLKDNGPYRVTDKAELESNPFSWNNKADVLYVEQPIGVGFSNSTNVTRMPSLDEQAAADIYIFIEKFVAKHPEYRQRNFYITGHSYGGHYVPATAKYFLDHGAKFVNLKGIAVGNGWLSPYAQFPSNAEYPLRRSLVTNYMQYWGATLSYYITNLFISLGLPRVSFFFGFAGDSLWNGS